MKYLVNVLTIAVIALLVWGAVRFKETSSYSLMRYRIDSFFGRVSNFVESKKKSIGVSYSPPRKPNAVTMIEREAKLREFAPWVFEEWSPEEWNQFWALIYETIDDREDGVRVKRQRTRREVEGYLEGRYSDPFASFTDGDWNEFWAAGQVYW